MSKTIVVFCCTSEETKDTATSITQKQLKNIKKDFPNIPIEKSFSVTEQSKLFSIFKQAVKLTLETNAQLIIANFAPFQRNLQALTLLKEEKITFSFIDLPSLKKGATLNFILNYLSYTKERKGQKIKARIKVRKEKGQKQGLENLGKEAVLNVISKANYTKKLSARIDPNTFELRAMIEHYKNVKKYSYRKIAAELNEKKLTTARGAQFGPKTVERLYKLQQELILRGSRSLDLDFAANPMMNQGDHFEVTGLEEDANLHEKLVFTLKNKVKSKIIVKILNNKEKENVIYTYEVPRFTQNFEIDLKALNLFLPGIYYLRLEAKNKSLDKYTSPFYFYKDALPKSLFES